jgi:drug/metabolite transporter (DMT)-like permease
VLLTLLVGGFLLWTASAFLPAFLADLEPLFLTIFLLCLQGVFFELFPLSVTDGGDIWNWRKLVWLAAFAVVFFCFYHFLLNPSASGVQALQQNGVQALGVLIVVFGLATLLLWLLFPVRLRRRATSQ